MLKKMTIIASIFLFSAGYINKEAIVADKSDFIVHKIVIQMNKNDKKLQAEVLTNIVNISKFYGIDNVAIEVVAYGQGIYFLTKDNPLRKRIESLMLQDVVFTACGNTIKTIKREKNIDIKLIDDIQIVTNGIPHIMHLQEDGYSYISP
jgi:intracellular sulfur oxidation DsrE/DsrF family protein